MIYALIAVVCLTVFFILPALVLTKQLFKRKNVTDFDRRVSDKGLANYMPYMDEILPCIAFMRRESSETVEMESDGVLLKAEWYFRGGNATAILLHGYCSSPMNNFSVIGKAFIDRGYNVLAVYERGHGKSGGDTTALGIVEQYDLLKWIEWTKKRTSFGDIVLYGISMGASTIAYSADRLDSPVRAAIIESAYESPYSQMYKGKGVMAVFWVPIMPAIRLFSKLLYGVEINTSVIPSLNAMKVPALFIGAEKDKKVPLKLFEKTCLACASEHEFIVSRGAPHALAFTAFSSRERENVFDFIEKHIKKQSISEE